MKHDTRLCTPWGAVRITRASAQLVAIRGESDCACYFGQGYAGVMLRLWQMELTRRLAAGRLGEILGAGALASDRFQRSLNLTALAEREAQRTDTAEDRSHISAYVAGANHALARRRVLPLELLLLRCRPAPFGAHDVHLVAQLKYFINSAWQFELYHTLVRQAVGSGRARWLFATFDESGHRQPALPHCTSGALGHELQALAEAAAAGLQQLGVASPDIGSNAFAVSASRSRSGAPLLACDPHMGLVNPGFNLLCELRSDEGLHVFGSSFPGAPGIVVGRNAHIAWGLTGVMMDNQDLYWGEIDLPGQRVRIAGQWQPLHATESEITVRARRSTRTQRHTAWGCASGQLLKAGDGIGLFLRWPALDAPIGAISLHALNRARDWPQFRHGLAQLSNSPGMAVYADRYNHIGLQTYGLLPRRDVARETWGSLVLPLDDARLQWQGYHPFDALPQQLDPPGGIALYANQYDSALFANAPHLSNRWHPPTRAQRIRTLLDAEPQHSLHSLARIQDDRVDSFAAAWLPRLLAALPAAQGASSPLQGWQGDTTDTALAQLSEHWLTLLCRAVLDAILPDTLARHYIDLWPGHRWNLLPLLFEPDPPWPLGEPAALIARTYAQAQAAVAAQPRPEVHYRHTLRGHPLARALLTVRHPYDGGNRETISALRRNVDFLTHRQSGGNDANATQPYSFGTSFKLVFDLGASGQNLYLCNMPASGNPLAALHRASVRRWRACERYPWHFAPALAE